MAIGKLVMFTPNLDHASKDWMTVTEKTSYGLGCTTIDRVTAEINLFPICKRNKTSNTKGS